MFRSIRYNALDALIDIHEVPLGARSETICLRRRSTLGLEDAADVDTRRGYGDPSLHAMSNPLLCERSVRRRTLPEALGIRNDVRGGAQQNGEPEVQEEVVVGALRLSANGHEGWILDGAEAWMRQRPPGVVLIEFSPERLHRAGYSKPVRMLEKLAALGYGYAAHSGSVCDVRWRNLTAAVSHGILSALPNVESGEDVGDEADKTRKQHLVRESTWCRLKPETFHLLAEWRVADWGPENIIFIHESHQSLAVSTAT